MEDALGGLQGVGIELAETLCDQDCADNVMCLLASADHAQRALSRLARAMARFAMCSVPRKFKALLQDWKTIVPK